MTSDDDLRPAYARAVAAGDAAGGHPDEMVWERLVMNEASPDERARVMAHVVACGPCTEIYRTLTIVRREAAAFDPDAPPAPAGVESGRPARRWIAYVAIAAAIAAAVAGSVIWRSPPQADPGPPPATTAAAPLRDHPAFRLDKPPVILSAAFVLTPRGEDTDRQQFLKALGAGLDAYRADDFEQAVRVLEPLSRTRPEAIEPPLYAGVSLLLLNRPRDAVPLLERAHALDASAELRAEAAWRLSLAYVHAGDVEAARRTLPGVCSTSSAHQAVACDGLRALPPSK
jgi:hypothetical protein